MAGNDYDRPKKSWREIDQGKDQSSHRKSGESGSKPRRSDNSQAYRSYKTQLNKLFDGEGAVPDALKERLGGLETPEAVKAEKASRQAILECLTPRKIRKAYRAYREEYDFPWDKEVIEKLLDLDDEDVILESFEVLGQMHAEGLIKRANSLKMRIKTAQMTVDTTEIKTAGDSLLEKLR